MNLAPIILFVYNRPWHTEQTLNALMQNYLANQSTLYIYTDGINKNTKAEEKEKIKQTRNVLKKQQWCKEVIIIEKEENDGLAKSIINGVTEVVNKHGKVIVLEDDIVTSAGFLQYMNNALSVYENNNNVFHISGFMYPHNKLLPETFFFNVTLCWGWATWKRAWNFYSDDTDELLLYLNTENKWNDINKFGGDYLGSQIKHNKSGRLKTWFIKWHISVYKQNGFTLYPKLSLVNNIGFDNTGVHNGETKKFHHNKLATEIHVAEVELVENKDAHQIVLDFYKEDLENYQRKISFKKRILKSIQTSIPFKKQSNKIISKIIQKVYPGISNNLAWHIIGTNSFDANFGKNCKLYAPYFVADVIIGNYTYIAQNANITKAYIGKFCSIGPNFLCGWGIHPVNGLSTSPMFYSTKNQNGTSLSKTNKIEERKRIYIGNDVFIGANVTILDGVIIGDGAVIAAGAVVSKNVEPYEVVGGVPAKHIKYRFDTNIIKDLLEIKWWNWNDDKLHEIEKNFYNIQEFIKLNKATN